MMILLRTMMLAVVTAGLVLLPCMAHAASHSPSAEPLPIFEASPSVHTSQQSILPAFRPIPLTSDGWKGEPLKPKRAPGILAPIGAFAAGTVVPSILMVQDAMDGYELYRAASGLHPAELQPRFHGTALVYSAISVGLAPAGAALMYMIGGGKVLRGLGGGLFGLVFAVIGVPMGGLLALALTSPYQENPEIKPKTVYTVYAVSLYGMTTSMSLAGFFLVGKNKRKKAKASLGLQPVQRVDRVALQPTFGMQF